MKANLSVAFQEFWNEFEKQVLAAAPEVQKSDMKMAFFSGAYSLMQGFLHNLSESDDVEDVDVVALQILFNQLEHFLQFWMMQRTEELANDIKS